MVVISRGVDGERMTTFDIVLTTRASLHPDGEPSEFVSEYAGVITATADDGGTTEVGRVGALKVHAGLAADHGEPLFDVCDSHSQELHVLHTMLYEPDGHVFRDALVHQFEAAESDLLVLDHVVLDPRWRGLRVGLLAVRKVVDLLGGGCGLAVAEISPLRREAGEYLQVPPSWLPDHPADEDRRRAARKLRRYYRRMGFERLGKTPYYALPTAMRTPTASDLLRPAPGTG
jgi:hypothetical protein